MTAEILDKLTTELEKGITTEVQVVYLLAGIRKIIERDQIEDEFPSLKFHCDWALHSSMDRAAAKVILRLFDDAYGLLMHDVRLGDLPPDLNTAIKRVSHMQSFETELEQFHKAYGLPTLTQKRSDGWAHFLHLYTKVISDIPLVARA